VSLSILARPTAERLYAVRRKEIRVVGGTGTVKGAMERKRKHRSSEHPPSTAGAWTDA
jgi:hypothetical protein